MDRMDDITSKRYLLSSIRLRFAPEVQQARQSAIDSTVERVLLSADIDAGITTEEVRNRLDEILRVHILHRLVVDSLQRLIELGRVEGMPESIPGVKVKKRTLYRLSTEARKELEEREQESTRRFYAVCERLFGHSEVGWEPYAEIFLKFLSSVFSRLAEENVRMIRGEISPDQLVSSTAFTSALDYVKDELGSLNQALFERAVVSFFSEPDPDYAAIQWNLAQNYYVLKVIGVDKRSRLLSKEVFGDAIFYLDTNVVISALEPSESHHKAFLALCNACDKLGVKVRVCKITLDELGRVVANNRDILEKVVNQIPEKTAVKVASDFFEAYFEKKQSGEEVDLDAVFAHFDAAGDKLKKSFKVETEDVTWFDEIQNDVRTVEFADAVATRYAKMRPRRKNDLVAMHDALCLIWMDEMRNRDNPNTWFVTRDYTLPGCVPSDCAHKSLAITIDALIQWLSPVFVDDAAEEDIALAYSEILRSRVLPQERIFNLEDFLIFHQLDMECKELPAEDVEDCILYIKQNAPLLDPTDPVDREKLARTMAIFFADPSRKYKQNLERYETELSSLQARLDNETKQAVRKDAWLRVSHIAILFLILEIIAVATTGIYGVGANTFQKIVNSWPFIIVPVPICIVVGWFYLGKKGLAALGWPMTKIFKHE